MDGQKEHESFSAKSMLKKEPNPSTEPDSQGAAKEIELDPYEYEPLKNPQTLRLLRLRPASDKQEDIDCEIVVVSLDETRDNGNSDDSSADGENQPRRLCDNGVSNPSRHSGNDSWDDEPESSEDELEKSKKRGMNKEVSYDPEHEPVPANKKRMHSYEAVSWCWGREPLDQILHVHVGDKVQAFHVSRNLKSALWALRRTREVRYLWIDAICINQQNLKERNQQVPRMDQIYDRAEKVCIWLGEGDSDSKLAMDFIKQKVLQLWEFDELIENKDMAKHWHALIRLMKRPWFSRRWVVQEIALSERGGTIYCGKEENSWQDFADAVSLFVEVETATHRLSDVMKLDQSFGNISDFFGDVSSLGAALLVDATSNLFRRGETGRRVPLSTLESLVSQLSIFEASQPRDTIYALLAISKDTVPKNFGEDSAAPSKSSHHRALKLAPKRGFGRINYNVDYKLPVIDVFQEFIDFSINRSDPTRALDIICRPWAPTVMESHDDPDFMKDPSKARLKKGADREIPLPSWLPSLSRAAKGMEAHPILGLRMERQNADPLVGMPDYGYRNYSAAGTRAVDLKRLKFLKWTELKKEGASYPEYSMFVRGFVLDEVECVEQIASNGNIPYQWLSAGGWSDPDAYPPEDFWRTLVADRGHGGRNPPTYFPRACKESMKFKAKTIYKNSGNLDSKKLINEGHCTIVAEFLRRVQEVIWNRQLIRTKDKRLGLVRDDVRSGFQICILYGCSVPVILQKVEKTAWELKAERRDRYGFWRKDLEKAIVICKARWMMKRLRREWTKRKAKITVLDIPLPTAQQQLEWVGRSRQGTWPLIKPLGVPNLPDQQSAPLQSPAPVIMTAINGADNGERKSKSTPESQGQENGAASPSNLASGNDIDQNHAEKPKVPAPAQTNGIASQDRKPPVPPKSKTTMDAARRKHIENELLKGKTEHKKRKLKEWNRPLPDEAKLPYYRLVGECYIHGMMNGEAITLQNKRRIPEKTFELR